MSSLVAGLAPVALLSSGLSAGVLTGTVLGGVPLLRSLPPDRYVQVHQFLAYRYEPFQPVCVAVAALVAAVAAVVAPTVGARVLFGLGAVLATAVVAVSATRTAPIKRWVAALDPDALPTDWDQHDPRDRFAAWNLARTVLAIAGFGVTAMAVAVLL